MRLTVNGREQETAATTIAALLAELALPAERVVVELNRVIVRREEFGSTAVNDGDRLELVEIVGGG